MVVVRPAVHGDSQLSVNIAMVGMTDSGETLVSRFGKLYRALPQPAILADLRGGRHDETEACPRTLSP